MLCVDVTLIIIIVVVVIGVLLLIFVIAIVLIYKFLKNKRLSQRYLLHYHNYIQVLSIT